VIDVLYEHPRWFARLFAALDERGVPYRRVDAASLLFAPDWRHDPAARAAAPDLLVNRMSPSADRRGHGHGILPTLQYLESMEAGGVRVINGSRAYGFEISKARQMALLADMGLPIPKTRVINDASVAVAATAGLRWPVVVKPSVGGSGAGVRRVDSERELREAVETGQLDFGVDRLALVQEFIPARDNHITRVEVLDGRYLYAIHVPVTGQSFNLCPADHCELPPPGSAAAASADVASGAVALGGNCVVEPPAPARRCRRAHDHGCRNRGRWCGVRHRRSRRPAVLLRSQRVVELRCRCPDRDRFRSVGAVRGLPRRRARRGAFLQGVSTDAVSRISRCPDA